MDTFKTVLDDFEPEEPNPDKEPGYLTLKDVTPRVTEDMKTQYQEQLNVRIINTWPYLQCSQQAGTTGAIYEIGAVPATVFMEFLGVVGQGVNLGGYNIVV